VLSPFKLARALAYADVLLPVAPFSETAGTFINTEGRVQGFSGVVKPLGDTRPAWKVLRVLGNLLGIAGFEYNSSEQVRDEALGGKPQFVAEMLDNRVNGLAPKLVPATSGMQRVAEVPIHFADALVRRAPSLQQSKDAAAPTARMNAAMLAKFGLAAGDRARIRQGSGEALLAAQLDAGLPDGCVRIAAAHPLTAALGALSGELSVERA
jgi:NADH-quinone oxidoreductase subunit G